MTEKSFGLCLNELLKIFNINGSTLARGINVDSSLIYKWIRDKRVPSYNSSYINLITKFLCSNIYSSAQRNSINNLLREWSIKELYDESLDLDDIISKNLYESQGYSIEKFTEKRKVKETIHDYNIGHNSDVKNESLNAGYEYPQAPNHKENINIIYGHKNILYFALNMLEDAINITSIKDKNIFVTLNNNLDFLMKKDSFTLRWKSALIKALNLGWNVTYLINLNNNVDKVIAFIKDMRLIMNSPRFKIYYFRSEEKSFNLINELFIIKDFGTLVCFLSSKVNKLEHAFLFSSSVSTNILTTHFSSFFAACKPLFSYFPTQKLIKFQEKFAEVESMLGSRYCFKGDISTLSMPTGLYEKFLKLSNKTKEEIDNRVYLHNIRVNSFKEQIKYYKFKDIWFKESIEILVSKKKYAFDQYHILEDVIPTDEDIICHLENVIYMLESNKNFEIALIEQSKVDSVSKLYWMVKENSGILIETLKSDSKELFKFYDYDREINLFISEKSVIKAFENYFISIWNQIDNDNRDKEKVINWLREQISNLNPK